MWSRRSSMSRWGWWSGCWLAERLPSWLGAGCAAPFSSQLQPPAASCGQAWDAKNWRGIGMAGEKFDVYLSSTKEDLKDERDAVNKLICNHLGWSLKHSYSASDQPVLDSCLADVRSARLYVGIIGMRHGSCPPDSDWSYTRHEFEEAHRHGIPTFVFVKLVDHVDRNQSAIDEFRARVSGATRVAQFRTLGDLSEELSKCQLALAEARRQQMGNEAPCLTDAIRGLLATDRAFVQLPAELPERWARIQAELHAQLEETYGGVKSEVQRFWPRAPAAQRAWPGRFRHRPREGCGSRGSCGAGH